MISEQQMSYATMQKKAISHRCGVCGGNLTVAWGGSYGHNCHVLICPHNPDHDVIGGKRNANKGTD